MTLTNYFLLHDPHNGCTLPMSSEPPLVKGTTWSASNMASVSPQARHLLPYSSHIASNSSAVKLPGLACLGVLLGPLLASGYYFVALTLVVSKFGSGYDFLVFCCPLPLVLGYLLFMFFVVFSACFDPMGKACSGFLVLG